MADDAARQHVIAVADARRKMADRRRRDAVSIQIGQAGNAGATLADAGIVQDNGAGPALGGQIGRIDRPMGCRDHDMPAMGFGKTGDAVQGIDRHPLITVCHRGSLRLSCGAFDPVRHGDPGQPGQCPRDDTGHVQGAIGQVDGSGRHEILDDLG